MNAHLLICGLLPAMLLARTAGAAEPLRFDFGTPRAAAGYSAVTPDTIYGNATGTGFDFKSRPEAVDRGGDELRDDFCTSDKPFYFSVRVPPGNYLVSVIVGDATGESNTTIKAETRRLMAEQVKTARGKFETRTFCVNVRRADLPGGGEVKLKGREVSTPRWDDKLTLEFAGPRPCVCAVEITRKEDATTVYILGDSTVCDQQLEPYASWGQMLPRFFKPTIAVANHAESGESLKSSFGAKRIEKVMSELKKGDYVLVQFGHNDQKDKTPGAGAFTTYQAALKQVVGETRKRGGIPVVITPVNRLNFDASGKIASSLGDFPEAVRQVAQEEDVQLIDLHAMSKPLYQAWGPENAPRAFAPNDRTHHNNYGAYELARCIVEGIRASKLELRQQLSDDAGIFDPAKPDAMDAFAVPASPIAPATKPEGN